MAPSDKTNELIGGILARAVRQCQVELFAYVFTSNHFHAMVRAPSAIAMSQFMQRLQSNIAVKVGRLVGWRGRFLRRSLLRGAHRRRRRPGRAPELHSQPWREGGPGQPMSAVAGAQLRSGA